MKLVHLFPATGWYVPGVPAVECDVTPARAAELLAYHPPAFTTTTPPPDEPAQPDAPAPDEE